MRIFFFTTRFHPLVGGIERRSAITCGTFAALGHDVVLATPTPGTGDDDRFPFAVVRQPSLCKMRELQAWCDVHMQMNVSLKHVWLRLLPGAPTVYLHANAYQKDDGTLSGPDRLKRLVARRSHGIANSRYTAAKVGCATVILNPYDDHTFRMHSPREGRPNDLVFLGRLVSQKGCDTLIRALGHLNRTSGMAPGLTIVGDGPDWPMLQRLVTDEGLADTVRFVGSLSGDALVAELHRHRIQVVPSRYEEPFGTVALEGLACGLLPIVSARGGLVDAIGSHGVTFLNGDFESLAAAIAKLVAVWHEPDGPFYAYLSGVDTHLARFTAQSVALQYLDMCNVILSARTKKRRDRKDTARSKTQTDTTAFQHDHYECETELTATRAENGGPQ